jgi:hypothetical protein
MENPLICMMLTTLRDLSRLDLDDERAKRQTIISKRIVKQLLTRTLQVPNIRRLCHREIY